MILGIASRFCAVASALSALVWFAMPGHYPLTGWGLAALAVLAGLVWLAEREAPRWSTP
jgi:hypothetical protein